LQNVIHLKISDDDDIFFIYYIHTLLIKLFQKDHNWESSNEHESNVIMLVRYWLWYIHPVTFSIHYCIVSNFFLFMKWSEILLTCLINQCFRQKSPKLEISQCEIKADILLIYYIHTLLIKLFQKNHNWESSNEHDNNVITLVQYWPRE
jgi:hypothetical protein